MILRNRFTLLISIIFACVAAQAEPTATPEPSRGTPLKAGEYRCTPSNSTLVRGLCEYRPRPNGTTALNTLLQLATSQLKPIPTVSVGPSPKPREFTGNNREPQVVDGTIYWWFETDEGIPDTTANEAMGNFFVTHDYGTSIQELPQIQITAEMHAFSQEQGHELGIEVGTFLGKRTLEEEPAELLQSLVGGIFKLAGGIGNPFASFLEIGLTATAHTKIARQEDGWNGTSQIGQVLSMNYSKKYYWTSMTSSQPITESIGFQLSAIPDIDLTKPRLVMLRSLSVSYSVGTGEANSPVLTFEPKKGTDTPAYTDQILVIGSESSESSLHSRKPLEGASSKESRKMLLLLKVSLLPPRQAPGTENPYADYESYAKKNQVREYTPAELEKLPEELPLEQILGSLEKRCVRDIVNPQNNELICGFSFARMDRAHLNHQVRLKLKKGGVAGFGRNNLYDEKKRVQYKKLGELYSEKGFYAIPAIAFTKDSSSLVLEITLDSSSPVGKARSRKETVKGIKVPFGYKRGQPEPVEFEPSLVKYLGRK